MNQDPQQDLRWLLRDKYQLSALQVAEFLNNQSATKFLNLNTQLTVDLQRISNGEPIQYVIGWVPFLNCTIDLSLRPLIPRSETEFWTQQLLTELKHEGALHILDMCCGSGCIGIALLKNLPNSKIDFADVSKDALKQTQLNVSRNSIAPERVQIFHSDLFNDLPSQQYDVVVCNPPYVNVYGEYSGDLKFEPEKALFAQKDGLELIERVIFDSKKYLKVSGTLVLEFGKGQEKAVQKLLKTAGWKTFKLRSDQFAVVRWVEATT